MTITNPGAINNSGAKQFTAQIAQVAKINYNRNLNNEEYNAYINASWYIINSGSNNQEKKCKKSKCKKCRKH